MADSEMLSFYREYAVAPVRQHVPDLAAHFARRRALYQQLGINAGAFTGRSVLEVGPGTGQNALFVAAQRPRQLVLVEPNPTGQEEIRRTFEPFPPLNDLLSVQPVQIQQFVAADEFDFVLCEGLVGASGHPEPAALISSIANHVRVNGVLVLTCIEYVAYLSEMLRRLLGIEITGDLQGINERVAALLAVFAPHLQSLHGMSRRHDDWIIDNLINPASVAGLVSFAGCVGYVSDRFDMLSTSPRFITDWTWYKATGPLDEFFNRVALECYWRNLHNFMDYRCVCAPRSESVNRSLTSRCEELHHAIREYENTRGYPVRRQIVENVHRLQEEVSADLPVVAEALAEVEGWLSAPSLDPHAVAQSEKFGTWFGRAATYMSLVRRV
jgi:SAM-dependent methyltransferase